MVGSFSISIKGHDLADFFRRAREFWRDPRLGEKLAADVTARDGGGLRETDSNRNHVPAEFARTQHFGRVSQRGRRRLIRWKDSSGNQHASREARFSTSNRGRGGDLGSLLRERFESEVVRGTRTINKSLKGGGG